MGYPADVDGYSGAATNASWLEYIHFLHAGSVCIPFVERISMASIGPTHLRLPFFHNQCFYFVAVGTWNCAKGSWLIASALVWRLPVKRLAFSASNLDMDDSPPAPLTEFNPTDWQSS